MQNPRSTRAKRVRVTVWRGIQDLNTVTRTRDTADQNPRLSPYPCSSLGGRGTTRRGSSSSQQQCSSTPVWTAYREGRDIRAHRGGDKVCQLSIVPIGSPLLIVDVLRQANETAYGLATAVFTKDANLAICVSNKLKAMIVCVRIWVLHSLPACF